MTERVATRTQVQSQSQSQSGGVEPSDRHLDLPRAVFLTPTLGRTGSEVALVNLLNALPARAIAGVASGQSGVLTLGLPPGVRVASRSAWQAPLPGAALGLANQLIAAAWRDPWRFLHHVRRSFAADLWVLNTLVMPEVIHYARTYRIPLVVQVHELAPLLMHLRPDDVQALITWPRLLVAVSDAVADMLRSLGRKGGIEVCPPAFDPAALVPVTAPHAVRARLGIAADAFIWGMAGTVDPNKNPERFIRVAARTLAHHPTAHFLWLRGEHVATGYETYCRERIRELGLEDRISFAVTAQADYADCVNACDAWFVPSNQESYSLVSVEAIHLGKPVVSCAVGGINEVVRPGCGVLVPPHDEDALLTALLEVMAGRVPFDAVAARSVVKRCEPVTVARVWERLLAQAVGPLSAPAIR
jgi:glycosyltransferase involved in cell wall biosynthesis